MKSSSLWLSMVLVMVMTSVVPPPVWIVPLKTVRRRGEWLSSWSSWSLSFQTTSRADEWRLTRPRSSRYRRPRGGEHTGRDSPTGRPEPRLVASPPTGTDRTGPPRHQWRPCRYFWRRPVRGYTPFLSRDQITNISQFYSRYFATSRRLRPGRAEWPWGTGATARPTQKRVPPRPTS